MEKPSGRLVSEKFKETRPSGRQAVCGSEAGEVIGKEVVRSGDTRYRSQKNQSFKRHFTHTRTHAHTRTHMHTYTLTRTHRLLHSLVQVCLCTSLSPALEDE